MFGNENVLLGGAIMNRALTSGYQSIPRIHAHHIIAVLAVLVIGLGAKQYFFPPMQAEADIANMPSASMNVLQMQIDHPNRNNLPMLKMNDMTFVFSDSD
jgi:hypothetical protein